MLIKYNLFSMSPEHISRVSLETREGCRASSQMLNSQVSGSERGIYDTVDWMHQLLQMPSLQRKEERKEKKHKQKLLFSTSVVHTK